MTAEDTARLLVRCPDRPGIVAAVSGFLHAQGANIHQSDQYSTDPEGGTFFLRQVFYLRGLSGALDELARGFDAEAAGRFGMDWSLHDASRPKRVAIMSRATTTACSTCSGAGAGASCTWTSRWWSPTTRTSPTTSRSWECASSTCR